MKASIKIIYWTPRVMCILAILFISVFALDAFQPNMSIWKQIGDFLLHLIPSFILLAFLILAWKREFIGGVIFLIIGIAFTPIVFKHNFAMNNSFYMSLGIVAAITFPFIVVGILFILSFFLKKKRKTP